MYIILTTGGWGVCGGEKGVLTHFLTSLTCLGSLASRTWNLAGPSSYGSMLGPNRANRLSPAPSPLRPPSLGCWCGRR